MDEPRDDDAKTITAQDARGGEIVLRTRRRRMIFLGGLIAFVVLSIVLTVLARS